MPTSTDASAAWSWFASCLVRALDAASTVHFWADVTKGIRIYTRTPRLRGLMVMEAAGYRFGDYWKLGGVVLAWYGIMSIFWVPLIWGF